MTLPILVHSCKQYCDLLRKDKQINSSKLDNHAKRQQRVYVLLILYLVCSLLACITYTFIRTNTFTFQSFTKLQCAFGFYFGYSVWCISKMLMYIIFLYRLRMAFHRSPYQYSPCFYNFMYSYIIILPIAGFVIFLIANSLLQDHWVLLHNQYTYQVWCTADGQSGGSRSRPRRHRRHERPAGRGSGRRGDPLHDADRRADQRRCGRL